MAAVAATMVAAGVVSRRLAPAAARCFAVAAYASAKGAAAMNPNGINEDKYPYASYREVTESIEQQLKAGSIRTPADVSAALFSVARSRKRMVDADMQDSRPLPTRELGTIAGTILESPSLSAGDYSEILAACCAVTSRLGNLAALSFKRPAEAALAIAESKRFPMDVDTTSNLIHLLIRAEVKTLQIGSFIQESIKSMENCFTNRTARRVLGVQDLALFDKESLAILSRALSVGIDDMRNRDVVANVLFLSRTVVYNHDLMRKCLELLDNHTSLFETRELLWCARALDMTGQNQKTVTKICTELQKKGRGMNYSQQASFLRILTNRARPNFAIVSDIVGQLLAVADKPGMKLTICEAILACKMEARKDILNTMVAELMQDEGVVRRNGARLMEIIGGSELFFGMMFNMPADVQSRMQLYETRSTSRNLYSLKYVELPEASGFKLETAQAPVIGRFTPAYVDANKRVVIEMEDPSLCRSIRWNAYNSAGYGCLFVGEAQLRKMRRAPEKLAMKLDSLLVRMGSLDNETYRSRYGILGESSE